MTSTNIPVSILDLVPLRQGGNHQQAIQHAVQLAQYAESLGYKRFWIAEHHNARNLASSATVVLINHVLAHTQSIQVGSGGVMLPNHAPLIVAEQFGTLETIYPGRLNLGLGRAPGTDMMTASALRRGQHDAVYTFGDDIQSLLDYFGPEEKQGFVKAYPGAETHVPIYVLGSSTDSAHLAARLGLPYVFAAHFAPEQMKEALTIYRNLFTPSQYLDKPYVMAGINVIAAETDEEAAYLSSSLHMMFLSIIRNSRLPLQPPTHDMDSIWSPQEKMMAQSRISTSLIGSKETIAEQLQQFQETYHVDELIAVSYIYDQDKQKRSYEILKEVTSN